MKDYEEISKEAKKMMKTILSKKNVCALPFPNNFSEDLREQTNKKVEAVNACELEKDASVSLSEKAELEVGSLHKSLLEWFEKVSIKVGNFLKKKYQSKSEDDKVMIKNNLEELQKA